MSKVSETLLSLKACKEAVIWAEQFDDEQTAWNQCQSGEWMLWLAAKRLDKNGSDAHKAIVLAACKIVRTVLHLIPKGETWPLHEIETAEAWARGEATLDEEFNTAAAYVTNVAYATRNIPCASYADIVRSTIPICPNSNR